MVKSNVKLKIPIMIDRIIDSFLSLAGPLAGRSPLTIPGDIAV